MQLIQSAALRPYPGPALATLLLPLTQIPVARLLIYKVAKYWEKLILGPLKLKYLKIPASSQAISTGLVFGQFSTPSQRSTSQILESHYTKSINKIIGIRGRP